ncbi:MAG TPA: hypothetical protein VFT59_00675, partial [Candidatus Saccharimonadales bacterium]|nr:hypothetical protein [Candidatus Saccharimonadales bacterium]
RVAMKEEESIKTTNLIDSVPRPTTYDLLIRQSKKLGNVAMKAVTGLKHFLQQDVPVPQAAENLMNTISFSRRDKTLQQANHLRKVVKESSQVLASARTVFPMTLFPDSVIVDRSKITIIKRDFFWTSRVVSIQIEDILNIEAGVGPFFGSLNIASRVMSSVDHFRIDYFWRNDAIFLKHLIQGYVIAKHNKIDLGELSKEEMIETLTGIGEDTDRKT